MINPAPYRIRRPRHYPTPSMDAIRWAVWLGANTPKRFAIARGISRRHAAEHLRRAETLGVLVRIGFIRSRTRPSPIYATPDPQEYP